MLKIVHKTLSLTRTYIGYFVRALFQEDEGLSKFIWPETCATTEPRKLSMWREELELVQGVRTEDGTINDKAAIAKMDFFTERGF